MNEKTCCFTGSRPQNLPYGFNENHADCISLKLLLRQEIKKLIENQNVTHFISGMALGPDQWAAQAVTELRKLYPHITLEAAVPCETQASCWNEESRRRYLAIMNLCNKKTVLQKQYSAECMQMRNRYMVDNSQIVLAVWAGNAGGTASTVRYARQCGRQIICINPQTLSVNY